MTSTTKITGTNQTTAGKPSRTGRRAARPRMALSAAATAVVAATSLGLGSSIAQADPGDTFVPIGSSQLVQSEDLSSIQVKLDTQAVVLNRDGDFSSCLGEGNPWTSVLKGSPKPISGTWTSRRRRDRALFETIAQAKTPAQAKKFTRTLLAEGVRDCQGKPKKFDFHYGPTTSSRVGSGVARWALSYQGDRTRADGGVVVFRKGTNVGFIQLSGTFGPADQTLESVAKVAVHRLAGE